MSLQWLTYHPQNMQYIENWLDAEAVRTTGLDDGVRAFYEYWTGEGGLTVGGDFWCNVVCEDDAPFAFIALSCHNQSIHIMEIVVAPKKRGQGLGAKLLRELIGSKELRKSSITQLEAVIYPGNAASQRAFEKAGFQYSHTTKDDSGISMTYVYKT